MDTSVFTVWNTPIFGNGADSLTIGSVIVVLGSMIILVILLRRLRRFVVKKVSEGNPQRAGGIHAVMLITNYTIGLLVMLILVQASGVNLHALTVVFGALSVGIGFGLQNVVNNFVCGIVLLFERPVRVGDRVTIDGYEGDIADISMRATTVRTNEGISVVVPNSHFVTSTVVNRSLDDHRIRIKIPVNIAYGTDPEQVRDVLLSVAASHQGALHEPLPTVIFDEYGPNALHFYLWVWTEEYMHRPTLFRSEMNYLISSALKNANIKVPFPQLDVHLIQ